MSGNEMAALAGMIHALETSNATLRETVKAMTALMGVMQQREERLRDIVNEQLQTLHHGVNRVGSDVNRVVDGALPRLTQLSQQALNATLQPAAEKIDSTVSRTDSTLSQASARYLQAQQAVESQTFRHAWYAATGLLVAAVIALGSAAYLLHSVRQEIAPLRAEVKYLQAVNQADWIPCEEGRLCANVEDKGPRHGDAKQYRLVAPRK